MRYESDTGRADRGHEESRAQVFAKEASLGDAAADVAAEAIAKAVEDRGRCTVMMAAAPSQAPLLAALSRRVGLPWQQVEIYHMDEYLGLPPGAPQLFSEWLRAHLVGVDYRAFHAIDGSASDAQAEVERYASALEAAGTFDLTFLGVGVNGHLAFNEPGQASLDDPEVVRVVDLETLSRQQQVDEGLFASLDVVPRQAITVTVPALLRTRQCLLSALGESKAPAVARMMRGPISMDCPASAVRLVPDARFFFTADAATGLLETAK